MVRCLRTTFRRGATSSAIGALVGMLSLWTASAAKAQDGSRLTDILNNRGRFNPPLTQPATMSTPQQKIRRVDVDPELQVAAGQLDDPNFAAREQATARLMDPKVDLDQLYALLAENQLSTEQRYRLLGIVRERLVNAPRGAIGVRMEGFPMPGGPAEVRIAELIPGLPAERVLEIGDRIVAVDGRPLNGSNDLITYVQNRQPGEKITLTVKRAVTNDHGDLVLNENNQVVLKSMEVDLTLGSAELLKETAGRFGPQQSPVEQARIIEARVVTDSFAPRPRRVSIEGEDRVSFGKTRADGGDRSIARLDPAVEQYWAIQALMLDQQLIREGRKVDSPEVRAQWRRQLLALMEMSQRPEVKPEDRDLLMRIAERFAELLDQPVEQRILPQ